MNDSMKKTFDTHLVPPNWSNNVIDTFFIWRDSIHFSHEGEDEQGESGWMSQGGDKICGEGVTSFCYSWVTFI